MLQHEGRIIPLEVKAQENLNAKSLKSFVSTYGLDFGVRMSMSDYRKQEKLINLPLYAVAVLWDAIMAGFCNHRLTNFQAQLVVVNRLFCYDSCMEIQKPARRVQKGKAA